MLIMLIISMHHVMLDIILKLLECMTIKFSSKFVNMESIMTLDKVDEFQLSIGNTIAVL